MSEYVLRIRCITPRGPIQYKYCYFLRSDYNTDLLHDNIIIVLQVYAPVCYFSRVPGFRLIVQ